MARCGAIFHGTVNLRGSGEAHKLCSSWWFEEMLVIPRLARRAEGPPKETARQRKRRNVQPLSAWQIFRSFGNRSATVRSLGALRQPRDDSVDRESYFS